MNATQLSFSSLDKLNVHEDNTHLNISDHLQTSEASQEKLILRSTRAESKPTVYLYALESPAFSLALVELRYFLYQMFGFI